MTSFLSHVTIDCHDAYALSEWWKPVLGYVDIDGDPNEPGHEECMIRDPESGQQLLFIEVPDDELPAKRIHLDVAPREGTRDDEVERLLAHGATLVADRRGQYGPGTGWVTLADPEGNQLCVIRNAQERGDG
ncbi:VOC family protein [Nocardioides sp. C4-1]|uniref:VOC family protein n=1 Tax=Nocardioides sp. C4-1 TaxID=3151851 RepID=UPI00326626C3